LLEPEKCEAWEWVTWDDVRSFFEAEAQAAGNEDYEGRRLFSPIANLFKQRPGFSPVQN
jgi:hypothetical protein